MEVFNKYDAVIEKCNKFDGEITDMYEFHILDNSKRVGFMPAHFVQEMECGDTAFVVDHEARTVHFNPKLASGATVVQVCKDAFMVFCKKNEGNFGGCLKKWLTKEPDYHCIRGVDEKLKGLTIPSAIRGIFGVVTTGVHMNMYTSKKIGGKDVLHVWVSRRSSKVTYAFKLDQPVAGAMDPIDQMDPLKTLNREGQEEAGLELDGSSMEMTYVKTVNGKAIQSIPVGKVEEGNVITFYDSKGSVAGIEDGHIEPGIRFTYDLKVDSDFVPTPHDIKDIDKFELRSIEDVKKSLQQGEWKPNCGLVMLDFLLRKGEIKLEQDKIAKLASSLQKPLPLTI